MNNFKRGGFKQRSGGPGGRPKFGNKFGSGRSGGDRSAGRMSFFPRYVPSVKKVARSPSALQEINQSTAVIVLTNNHRYRDETLTEEILVHDTNTSLNT